MLCTPDKSARMEEGSAAARQPVTADLLRHPTPLRIGCVRPNEKTA